MMTLDKVRVTQAIEADVSADILSGRVGGAALLVKQHGQDVYRRCFGNAKPDQPLTPDALFRMASMTKPITAVAIMQLVERGLLSLDDPLDRFIPAYADMDIACLKDDRLEILGKAQNKVTILHLLTHSSGIACDMVGWHLEGHFTPEREHDLASVAQTYADYPLAFEPYTQQAYSGRVGFDLLAHIVELTSGMPYDEYLQKELFSPLRMTDTTFHPTDEQWERMVHMHDYQDGRAMYDPLDREHIFEQLPLQYFCGGAGLASTLSDYEKFADMLLRGGKTADGEVLLGEKYIRLMRTVAIPEHIMPGNQKWGLGMRVICDASYAALPVNTFGWSGAYGTHFWVDPDNGVVGIYMKNSKFDGGSGAKTAADFERNVYLP